MKKTLLAVALITMGLVSAQEFRFGPKGGYSMSSLNMKVPGVTLTKDPMHTFYVGGLAEYKINDKFAVQGEALYSALGGKHHINDDEGVFDGMSTKVTLQSVLVPISAKYFITEGFSVSAGASFGLILSAKAKTVFDGGMNIPGVELETSNEEDIKDQLNSLNIAPFIGAEYAFENGFFIDARYNYGISELSKHKDEFTMKNSFAQVGVGFKLGGN